MDLIDFEGFSGVEVSLNENIKWDEHESDSPTTTNFNLLTLIN